MAEHDDLLKRFAPELRYDSNEQYFVDSAAQWTECPGNELRRKDVAEGKTGKVIASAVPAAGEPQLSLQFLGPEVYGNGEPWRDGDIIANPGKNYREEYVRLRTEHRELNNIMYARAVEENGRLWLQYWFWYFYNDYQLALGAGLHEGDWEMIQLRMHPTEDRPDVAVYAQHTYGEKRSWSGVEKVGEHPVVYPGRGSHASYFEKGFHQTEAWYDLADGKRKAPQLTLELIRDDTHAWMRWKGRWGDTKAHDKSGLHADAPTGPGHKKQWNHPTTMLNSATETKLAKAQAAPDVDVVRDGGKLRIDYDFTKRNPRPIKLVVTVNSRDEKGVPPKTHNVLAQEFDPSGRGSVTTDIALDAAKHYDVYTSTVGGDPPKPSESTLEEIDSTAAKPKEKLTTKIAVFISKLFATIRGDR